jgi:ribonuclease-3 family protein
LQFEDILLSFKDSEIRLNSGNASALNPLTLAYIGDAVYEIYIRTALMVSEPDRSVHKLHNMATGYVKAHAQCELVHKLTPYLIEEELDVIRRGRNSKSGSVPKNADVIEYRTATGFEALIGYLYIQGKTKRLMEILSYSIQKGQDEI